MSSDFIGKRLRAIRESKSISQDTAAERLGINDRQTISAIETGHRRMSVDELLLAADVFDVSVGYFTDPFRLEGEGQFSWRANGAKPSELKEWEARAGSWIALFRTLRERMNMQQPLLRHSLSLSKQSSFEDASTTGERFCSEFELGENPAKQLDKLMESHLNYLVLSADMGLNISGAAVRVSDLDAVLVARNEITGRRNFTLAHELFHMLTWDAMPPSHVEESGVRKRNHVETLGDNFASALLMPSYVLQRYGSWTDLSIGQLINKLNSVATELGVTSQALKWRLVNVGSLKRLTANAIADRSLRNNGNGKKDEEIPALFSKHYIEVIGRAIDAGHVSVRRVVDVLDMTFEDLQDLFKVHDVDCDLDL